MVVKARTSNINIIQLYIIGTVVCFISATLLHFSYDWSNGSVWSILFAAANESIWEHIKILTLPYLLWSFIELSVLKVPLKKLIVAKTAGTYFITFATIVFFKFYTSITKRSVVFVDITSAFLWIAIAFFITYKILNSDINFNLLFTPAVFALLLFIVMFLTFTINPPQIDVFLDPISNSYGIQNKYSVKQTLTSSQQLISAIHQI